MVTPSSTTELAPIHTSSPMLMPSVTCGCRYIGVSGSSKPWLKPTIDDSEAMRTPFPQLTLPEMQA
ncbi:hypothetical protein D3C87_2010450 [compost metagenome]